jgi:hypothetical protein
MLFEKKNCRNCKFCYKVKKELTEEEKRELEKFKDLKDSAECSHEGEQKVSDLTECDLSDMYGLRQEYQIKCFKGQWDEEAHPELKTQSLEDRECKYFASRKENLVKTYEQVEKEQNEKMGVKMHKESLEWMQISFLLGITSLAIGLISRIPNLNEKVSALLVKIRSML